MHFAELRTMTNMTVIKKNRQKKFHEGILITDENLTTKISIWKAQCSLQGESGVIMAKLFQAYLFAILKQGCAVGLQKYL